MLSHVAPSDHLTYLCRSAPAAAPDSSQPTGFLPTRLRQLRGEETIPVMQKLFTCFTGSELVYDTGLERVSFTRLQQLSEGHALQSTRTQVIVLQQTDLIIGHNIWIQPTPMKQTGW